MAGTLQLAAVGIPTACSSSFSFREHISVACSARDSGGFSWAVIWGGGSLGRPVLWLLC